MSQADDAEGRTICISLNLSMVPPGLKDVGHTDHAMDIARRIVDEITDELRARGEAEGFSVKIEKRKWVY